MRPSSAGYVGFLLFLAGYAAYKYSVAAPPQWSPAYATSVAALVALTGIAPFIASLLAGTAAPGGFAARLVVGAVVGSAVCVAGYAVFFYLFIAPNAPNADVLDVARRGVGWGALQGVLGALAASRSAPGEN